MEASNARRNGCQPMMCEAEPRWKTRNRLRVPLRKQGIPEVEVGVATHGRRRSFASHGDCPRRIAPRGGSGVEKAEDIDMKRNAGRFVAAMLFLGTLVAVMFGGSAPAEAQRSIQPCINACSRAHRQCIRRARSRFSIRTCERSFNLCVRQCHRGRFRRF